MPILGVRDKVKNNIPGREKQPSYANAGSKSSSGSKEKSGIRGHVSGLVHRGSNEGPSHQARPINELRDPNSFAPPPRRTNTGLGPAPPPSTAKRSVVASPSKYEDPRGPRGPPPEKQSADPALLEWHQQHGQQREQQEEEEKPRGPYRVDTSGLRTDHLPPPPKFNKAAADVKALPPPTYESATGQRSSPSPAPAPPPRANTVPKGPSLPPRLPPRTNSTATTSSESSEPAQMNQGAVNRPGAAGVSVPGLGIGKPNASPSPPPPPRQQSAPMNELQNRFSKLRTTNQTAEEQPAEGTTWAQKQAALKTASNFNKDPSSVSLADAKSAAGTANNSRQRHGDQVAAGVKSANSLNQKYGVTNKVGAFNRGQQEQQQGVEEPANPAPPVAPQASGIGKKKPPPPPPPKKKPGLVGNATVPAPAQGGDEPPPIPMSTRPTF